MYCLRSSGGPQLGHKDPNNIEEENEIDHQHKDHRPLVDVICVDTSPFTKPALLIIVVQLPNGPGHNNGEWDTPANADKHPFAQLIRGVGQDNSRVEVTPLTEHPKEVGRVEIIEGGSDQAAPDHIALVHLGTHRQLDNKPGSVPEDKGRDEVPVDDVSQAADAPQAQEKEEGYE